MAIFGTFQIIVQVFKGTSKARVTHFCDVRTVEKFYTQAFLDLRLLAFFTIF